MFLRPTACDNVLLDIRSKHDHFEMKLNTGYSIECCCDDK